MKNLFLILIIGCCAAIISCKKQGVSPAYDSKIELEGTWDVVSDSSYWSGQDPKKLVSAYTGKSGDIFNFSADGKLYIHEDALSDTPTYSVDTTRVTVTYIDATHFNEAPGFGIQLYPVGFDPTMPVAFTQKTAGTYTLTLSAFSGTPDGFATRYIHLKKDN